ARRGSCAQPTRLRPRARAASRRGLELDDRTREVASALEAERAMPTEREPARDELEPERAVARRLRAGAVVFDDAQQLARAVEPRADRDLAAVAAAQRA